MNAVESARGILTETLAPHFKGRNAAARLEKAVSEAVVSIEHLLATRATPQKKLGVTIMTETASYGKRPPRTV